MSWNRTYSSEQRQGYANAPSRQTRNSDRSNWRKRDERADGCWFLTCDDEAVDEDGHTEAGIVWRNITSLYEKHGCLFSRYPERKSIGINCLSINCSTEDSRDTKGVLRLAEAIRNCIEYPYIIYYYEPSAQKATFMYTVEREFYRLDDRNVWRMVENL